MAILVGTSPGLGEGNQGHAHIFRPLQTLEVPRHGRVVRGPDQMAGRWPFFGTPEVDVPRFFGVFG